MRRAVTSVLDARRGRGALAALRAARRARVALHQADTAIVPAGRGDRGDAAAGRAAGAPAARRVAGDGAARPRRRRRRGRRPAAADRTSRPVGVVVTADAWTNDVLAPPRARSLPLDGDPRAGHLLRARRPGAFAPDRLPVWIWMDDPSFYGFPTYGEAARRREGGAGLRRAPWSPPTARSFDADPARWSAARRASWRGCCPASARRRAR